MRDHIDEDDDLFADETSPGAQGWLDPSSDVAGRGPREARAVPDAEAAPDAEGVRVVATVAARDPRARIRGSRLRQFVVLLVTAAVVIAGAQIVRMQQASDAASQTGGATVVKLPGQSQLPPPAVGRPAQDFTLTTIDGATVSLAELRGRPVWIAFGASWCSACQAEMPDIQAAATRYAGSDVVVLGINISEDDAAVRAYARRVGLTFPLGADPASVIADEYAVGAIPAHYFVGRDGLIRDIRVGGLATTTMNQILDGLVAR